MRVAALTILLVLALAVPAGAAPSLVTLGNTFTSPTWAGSPPGDTRRVFVTERPGQVRLILDGAVQSTPFLDLTPITLSSSQERGLLSLAFAPDYATSGRFYVYLTAQSPGTYKVGVDSWQPQTYALAVKPGDQRWLNWVNAALHEYLVGLDFSYYQAAFKERFGVDLGPPPAGFPVEYK